MLGALLKMSGFFILRLIYGKDSKRLEKFGVGIPLLLSLSFIFWLMSLLFLFSGVAAGDTWFCIVFAIAYPLGLLLWRVLVRRRPADAVSSKVITQDYVINQKKPKEALPLERVLVGTGTDEVSKFNMSESADTIQAAISDATPECDDGILTSKRILDKEEPARDEKELNSTVLDNASTQEDKKAGKKQTYCKRCGGLIDQETKKCQNCGKQYFRAKRVLPAVALIALCLILAILNIVQYNYVVNSKAYMESLQSNVAARDNRIKQLEKEVNNYLKRCTDAEWKADAFDEISAAVQSGNLGYVSNNFHSSESVIVVPKFQIGRKFTLTAYWPDGGTVSVDYSSIAATVNFDKNSWETSTSMTITPHFAGATTVTFSNNVDSETFQIVIVVTD